MLVSELEATGVPIHPVGIAGSIRTNVTLADESGVTTKVNAPGPELSDAELDALLDAVAEELIRGARCVVAAGSLPASVPVTFLDRLAQLAAEHRTPYAVDTSGAPLARAVAAGGLAVVKPNDEELAELVGRELVTVRDVVAASHEVLARRNDAVLVSLGAHGALLTTASRDLVGRWRAAGPGVDRRRRRLDPRRLALGRRLARPRATAHRRRVGPRRRPAAGHRRCLGLSTSTSRPCASSPTRISHSP